MNRNLKLTLMFLPLLVLFAVFSVAVNDLRHPTITHDDCKVTAVGADALHDYPESRYLYRQSENPLHDISLQCNREGALILNDLQLRQTPVKQGQDAELLHKRFQFLPERWVVSIHTGKPKN